MAAIMAATTIRMSIMRTMPSSSLNRQRFFALALLLPALALFHAALISALLALGFIDAADDISFNNPDVAEAQAKKYRAIALGTDASTSNSVIEIRKQLLVTSLDYWQQAISARPLWPYYRLGALDIEVLLQDEIAIKQRTKEIIKLAPNERGLDLNFLSLAFVAWDSVDTEEREWLLTRLGQVNPSTLRQVYSYAKQANTHRDICSRLVRKKVRKICSQ